jgi:hypothetical protein
MFCINKIFRIRKTLYTYVYAYRRVMLFPLFSFILLLVVSSRKNKINYVPLRFHYISIKIKYYSSFGLFVCFSSSRLPLISSNKQELILFKNESN